MVQRVVEVVGLYNADGGVLGEMAYVVGHLVGRADCSLCDVTHGRIRRRPEWDAMTAGLPVPVRLVHRNQTSAAERGAAEATGRPVLLGVRADGSYTALVLPARLVAAQGSAEDIGHALRQALDEEEAT